MNTVNLNAINRDKFSSEDFNPMIGVSDSHLLVSSRPSVHGPFEADNEKLPSILAKSFRVTNAGSNNILVDQKVLVFSRYFDDSTIGLFPDSPSVKLETVVEDTPVGESQVLELTYNDDTAAYSSVPVIPLSPNLIYSVYFKLKSIDQDLQPLGVYTERSSIDINFPAAAIRIKPDMSIVARVGYVDHVPATSSPIIMNEWHRASIIKTGSDFKIQVDRYSAGSFIPLVSSDETYTSIGAGLLDEIDGKETYSIAFASEGGGVQQVDAFEVYKASTMKETLIAGTTKEYYCNRSLDEYTVDGQVSGYYRS